MRYSGGGVGHYRVPLRENRGSVEPAVESEAPADVSDEDLDTDEHHSTGITGHGVDGDVPINANELLEQLTSSRDGELDVDGDEDVNVDDADGVSGEEAGGDDEESDVDDADAGDQLGDGEVDSDVEGYAPL